MGYIYKIVNDINDKIYIGKTIYTPAHRFKEHCKDAKNHKYQSKLHKAMRKYGFEHFSIQVLEECDDSLLSEKEQQYIYSLDTVQNGYNITYGGEGETTVNIQEIISLFLEGKNITEIHSITGYTTKTISKHLKNNGYIVIQHQGNKDKGKKVQFQNMIFDSVTLLAKYLQTNIDVFKDKKIETIIKGISKSNKQNKLYCGYSFYYL